MTETSQLLRSRLAVLAISGFAAAYGIYTIFHTFSDAPNKNALHRSNAVHRPRPPRPSRPRSSQRRSFHIIDYTAPGEATPLGILVLHHPESHEVLETDLTRSPLPVLSDLEQFMGVLAHEVALRHELRLKAIECIFYASLVAYDHPWRHVLAQYRLEGLPQALTAWNREAIHEYEAAICALISQAVTSTDMDEAIARLIESGVLSRVHSPRDDLDTMTNAETEAPESRDGATASSQQPTQGLKGLLYHIAESDAKRKAYLHRGIHCEDCGERPIRGVRWHCLNCADFDLCSTCEMNTTHPKTHVFAKIQIPLPRVSQPTQEASPWYPGDPTKVHGPLSADLKKRLGDVYGFDGPHMDAHYDQFCCIANVPWRTDPNGVQAGIDRRAFNKALTGERWPQRFRPNALYDRMFAFYDTNQDGIIGFEEFVSGLAYLRGRKRFGSLRRALEGFDMDSDGYVSRQDFLRIFRAKYEIQQLIIGDMVVAQEQEHSRLAMETLRSSQPISSVFNNDEIPLGEVRMPGGKCPDAFQDMQPEPGSSTILGNNEAWHKHPIRLVLIDGDRVIPTHEGLQGHLSRFEELLSSPSDRADGADYDEADAQAQGHGAIDPILLPNYDNGADPRLEQYGHIQTDEDSRLDQDILWEVIEQGFNELLDGLFQAKEKWDQEVINSRKEREKWREEIDKAVKEKKALEESLKSGSEVDPLMAAALDSFANTNGHPHSPTSGTAISHAMIPTDTASLEVRESEISRQSLHELLDSAGYGVLQHHEEAPASATTVDVPCSVSDLLHLDSHQTESVPNGPTESVQAPPDLTMPQNRPNSVPGAGTTITETENATARVHIVTEEEDRPSREHFEDLSRFDELDREIRMRGGPGILSYEEVEELAQADGTKELRGLITGWLELASF